MRRKYKLAVGILGAVVMPALIVLMAALSDFARWGGYADALPLVTLLVLFVVGNLIVTSANPRARRRNTP